jgi:GntR family transcriptional regulator, transcriptional repressor for pyruvate dehydrogenase complex
MPREMFSSVSTSRIALEIEKQIKGAIFSEQLKPGNRLSSEQELSKIFNTSRTTVREALRTLEREGFLTIKQGVKGGSFIREADFSPIVNSITHMLQFKRVTIENLTEARLIIEPEIARLAALKSLKPDIQKLEESLDGLRQVVAKKERSTSTNIQFHRIIGECCKNPALLFINGSLLNILQENLSRLSLKLENNRLLLEQHILIHEAIEARQSEKAYSEMRCHILTVKKIMRNV